MNGVAMTPTWPRSVAIRRLTADSSATGSEKWPKWARAPTGRSKNSVKVSSWSSVIQMADGRVAV